MIHDLYVHHINRAHNGEASYQAPGDLDYHIWNARRPRLRSYNGQGSMMMNIPLPTIQYYALLAAIMLYALCGSPTPDSPGMVEGLIAVLLIVATSLPRALATITCTFTDNLWLDIGKIALLYGLGAGMIMGLVQGHEPAMMLRDIIPFLFLFLPLFVGHHLAEHKNAHMLMRAIIMLGVCFGLRALLEYADNIAAWLFFLPMKQELTYFANAPTLLFAALFIGASISHQWLRAPRVKTLLLMLGALALAAALLVPLGLTLQRASLGYALLYSAVMAALALWHYPARMALLIAALGLCLICFAQDIQMLTIALAQKTSLVGLNMRLEEAKAIWQLISDNPLTLIFGAGWGASFISPAVGNLQVGFSHSLWSSMLLKTGIIGMLITLGYIGVIIRSLMKFWHSNPVFVLALLGPIIIDVFLYAAFKSLDFGLILLLACPAAQKLQTRP